MRKKAELLRFFPRHAYGFCFDHARQRLLLYNFMHVILLELKTNTIIFTINHENYRLEEFAFSLDDKYIYAIGRSENSWYSVYQIDTTTGRFEELFVNEDYIQSFCLSPDGNYVYVSNTCGRCEDNNSRVAKIDTKQVKFVMSFRFPLANVRS